MLTKTLIALSAVALLGTASVAAADEVESKIGDRYAFLAQGWKANGIKAMSQPAAYEDIEGRVADRYPTLEPAAGSRVIALRRATVRVAYEVPENRIGDKYPILERNQRFLVASSHRNGRKG